MHFRVGPFVYALVITDERPRAESGEAVDGLIDFDHEQILIFTGVRGRRRLNVLLHELGHAWDYHFGPTPDAEASANHKANYAQQAMQDLDEQGGLQALDALTSSTEAEAAAVDPIFVAPEAFDAPVAELAFERRDAITETEAPRLASLHRRDKPCCGGWVYERRMVTSRPRWLDRHGDRPIGGFVVDRACYCASCGVLSRWIEAVDPVTGSPAGPIDEAVQMTRREHGDQIDQFLGDHPECVDVSEAA